MPSATRPAGALAGGPRLPAPPGATPQPRQRAAVRRPGRLPVDAVRRRRRERRLIQTFKEVMVLSSCTRGGTASMVVARGVRACRTWPRHGMRHMGNSRAHCGDADAGRPGLPSHAPCAGRRQAEQETAAWSLPTAVVGGGSVTHEARSGGGPGEGFLADMRRSNQGRVDCELQMLEDLPDHLAVRDGGNNP